MSSMINKVRPEMRVYVTEYNLWRLKAALSTLLSQVDRDAVDSEDVILRLKRHAGICGNVKEYQHELPLHKVVAAIMPIANVYNVDYDPKHATLSYPIYNPTEKGDSEQQYRKHIKNDSLWKGQQRVLRIKMIQHLVSAADHLMRGLEEAERLQSSARFKRASRNSMFSSLAH